MAEMERRDFLRMGLAAGVTAAAFMTPVKARAAYTTVTVEQIREMDPVAMAQASSPVMAGWENLQKTAAMIRNPQIRSTVQGIMKNPAPTLMKGIGSSEKKEIWGELKSKGLIKDISLNDFLPPAKSTSKSNQPFYSAPGSGYQSHHAYPGGLITHTDLNTRVSLALYEGYREVYDYLLDRDVVIASQLMHDLHKPWVFQWQKNGESRGEMKLGGTGEHHPLGVAESIVRGLPAEVIVAQACAHNHPRTPKDEAQVVGWIQAASIIAGVDPVKRGLLASGGKTLPLPRRQEGFVCHLGDHDWILTVPASQWLIPVMKKVAQRDYSIAANDEKTFNSFRNYVFSQGSIMGLYEIYAAKGEDELVRTVHSIVTPA